MEDSPRAHYSPTAHKNTASKAFLGIIALVILCALSFYGGVKYQKGKAASPSITATENAQGFGGGAGGYGGGYSGQRPTRGQVTAISSSSITVQNSTSGTSTTFSITSSTTISDNGQTVTISDIQTGDTVFVIANGAGSTTASRIIVNPSYGGGASSQSTTTAPSTTTD